MLGPLALISMRQKHDERTGAEPLGLGGADKLIDDDLGAVGKITELGLPHAEHLGIIHRVTVVEAKNGGLRKRAVVDAEAGLIIGQMTQRDVTLAIHLVIEDGVTVTEGAAAAVLTGETDRDPLKHEGTERECFAIGPVIAGAFLKNLTPAFQDCFFHLRKDAEVRGYRREAVDNRLERLLADGRLDRSERVVGLENSRRSHEGLLVGLHVGDDSLLHLGKRSFQMPLGLLPTGIEVFLGKCPQFLGMLEEDLAGALVRADHFVKIGLGEERFVPLVVAVAAVANNVDNDVAPEFLAEGNGNAGCFRDGDRIVTVHVQDRGLHRLGNLGAVKRGTRILGQCGETDLIVHNEVHRPANLVTIELREVEALGNDSLTWESGVTMNEDRNDFLAIDGILEDALARAGLAENDGIYRLEVTRIGGEINLNFLALLVATGGLVTEVVLDIPARLTEIGIVLVAELVKDDGEGLLEEIGQDIETTAMSHAEYDLLHTETRRAVEDLRQGDHHRLTALQREALAANVGRVNEILETLGFVKGAQDPVVRGFRVSLPGTGLDPFADPVADARVLDVHVLDTHGVAVDGLHLRDDFAEFERRAVTVGTGADRHVKVCLGQAEFLQLKKGLKGCLVRQRVDAGKRVSERAVRIDKCLDTALKRGVAGSGSRRLGAGNGCGLGFLITGVAEFETLEERGPISGNGCRVPAPFFVVFINGRLIPAGREGCAHEVKKSFSLRASGRRSKRESQKSYSLTDQESGASWHCPRSLILAPPTQNG